MSETTIPCEFLVQFAARWTKCTTEPRITMCVCRPPLYVCHHPLCVTFIIRSALL